jgi:DNA-directed RNA polymerase specialized sigma24 family protein
MAELEAIANETTGPTGLRRPAHGEYARMLLRYALEGVPMKEMAATKGCTHSAVSIGIHGVRRDLRKRLDNAHTD